MFFPFFFHRKTYVTRKKDSLSKPTRTRSCWYFRLQSSVQSIIEEKTGGYNSPRQPFGKAIWSVIWNISIEWTAGTETPMNVGYSITQHYFNMIKVISKESLTSCNFFNWVFKKKSPGRNSTPRPWFKQPTLDQPSYPGEIRWTQFTQTIFWQRYLVCYLKQLHRKELQVKELQ